MIIRNFKCIVKVTLNLHVTYYMVTHGSPVVEVVEHLNRVVIAVFLSLMLPALGINI